MSGGPTNSSWTEALDVYDSLHGPAWKHIPAFRHLVATLAKAPEAVGLTAVTSHEVLTISPYTRYPDWFTGRHVKLHPLPDGKVRVDRCPEPFDSRAAETWTLPLSDALEKVLRLIAEL